MAYATRIPLGKEEGAGEGLRPGVGLGGGTPPLHLEGEREGRGGRGREVLDVSPGLP